MLKRRSSSRVLSYVILSSSLAAQTVLPLTAQAQGLSGGQGLRSDVGGFPKIGRSFFDEYGYTLGQLLSSARWDDALKSIDKEIKRQPASETEFYSMARALVLAEKKEWSKVAEVLGPLKLKGGLWTDYINLLSAKADFHLGQLKSARQSAELVRRADASRKIYNDAQLLLGQIAISEGRFTDARTIFVGLEKRVKNEVDYPQVLWNLALSERGIGKTREFCARATKLYRDFPDWNEVKTWGPFLDENKMNAKETMCAFSWDDLLGRSRNLMLSGFVDRAKSEIEMVEKRSQGQKNFEIDRLKAHYDLHEGEVTHALGLLAPYYQLRKNDPNYLSVVASAAARAGDSTTAIGTYLNIYKMSPRSPKARQALFQAAFLSYQYQDYDGATRRFRQFLTENGGSGLAMDAEWHLAWITYLKGNYAKAYQELAKLKDRMNGRRHHRRTQTVDRVEYWMAMSQLKLKNFDQARTLFSGVLKMSGESYYALASRQRLKQITELDPPKPVKIARWTASVGNESRRPQSRRPILMPFDSTDQWAETTTEISMDSEDAIVINPLQGDANVVMGTGNEEGIAEITDQKTLDVGDGVVPENLSSSPDPQIVQRFERARRLIDLGLTEFAKWELYEIERKTANKDYLRTLMTAYESIEQFHRSSAIATHRFITTRNDGIEQQKLLWEKAYPRAYEKLVGDASGKFDVPKEMIWAIMRAESSFKRDAISPVGALGLMQVMPKTGTKISEIMGERNFDAQKLLQPGTVIPVGTKYLQRLSKGFESNRALMAAAYNAGPHRVKTWLNRFGSLELDEFIEHIPFLETRNYVKKVVTNFQIYAHVYSNKTDVFPELTQPISIRILEPVPMKETWEDI